MLFDPIACGDSYLLSSTHAVGGDPEVLNRLRRCLKSNDAAGRAAAGYLSLLVQRKVTQRKHAPEPPKPPALLAEGGACQTAHPCAAGRFALPARTALRAACSAFGSDARRRLRGPDVKSNILKACAARTLLGFWFSAPSELAEHRSLSRGCARALFEHESRFSIRASCAAPGLSEERRAPRAVQRGERSGVLSFGYFSLHKQRKVTRPRRGNRTLAFQASPQAIQKETVRSVGHTTWTLRMPIHE